MESVRRRSSRRSGSSISWGTTLRPEGTSSALIVNSSAVDTCFLEHRLEAAHGDVVEPTLGPHDLHLDPSTLGLDVVTDRGGQDEDGERRKNSDSREGDGEKP